MQNLLLLPNVPNLLVGPKRTPVYEKTEYTTFGMEIFREKLSAKGISEEPSILIGSTRGSGTIFPSQTDLM